MTRLSVLLVCEKRGNAHRTTESLSAGVHHDQLWGDLNLVNGQPWPFLDITASWQRFRILNADISRPRILMVRFPLFQPCS